MQREVKTEEVSIIMPCYHNYEISKDAIISVLNFTDDIDYRLILINDGNDRQLEKYFKTLEKYNKNIEHITNKKNIGWVQAINQGIKKSDTPYILFLNNDVEIPYQNPHWLKRMKEPLSNGVGAVGPTSNFVMGYQHRQYNPNFPVEHYTKFLIGFCMLTKREVIEEVGGLDERFGLGGNDDLDFSIRIKKAGWKLKIVRDVFIEHKGTMSLPLVYDNLNEMDDKTRKILENKWDKKTVSDLFAMGGKDITEG